MAGRFAAALLACSALLPISSALSQTDAGGAGGSQPLAGTAETSDQPAAQPPPDSIQSSLGPYGDIGGLRGTLAASGITYSLTYTGEVLGNVSGGQRRGTIYEGRLDAQFDVKLDGWGWQGANIHTNFYQIHGRGLTRDYLGNLLTASGIEALPSTRLYELSLEQKLFGDTLSIRGGQLAADTEFVVSQYATLFVNSTFGFPGLLAANLPNGGPAYPLATPGIRAIYAPSKAFSASLGIFNGAPAGMRATDPQRQDRSGLEFRTDDPALLIGEVAFNYDAGQEGAPRPGTVKLGAWGHLGSFGDLRYGSAVDGAASLPLADPAGSGVALRRRGNAGGYLILDQLLYREQGTEDGGLGIFVRLLGAPGDRNLVSFYADGGFSYKGLIPGRPNDTLGLSFAYARISDAARGFDADTGVFAPLGAFSPIRTSEALMELTYQAQIVPGWTVQPDLQYVHRPGGGVVNPRSPYGASVKDALVLGARSTVRY